MDKVFDRCIYFDVATFDNLREKGLEIKDIFSEIIENTICRFQYPFKIDIEKINGRRKVYHLNDKNWNEVCKMLVNGEIQHIMIVNDDKHPEQVSFFNPAIALSATCDYQQEFKGFGYTKKYANNMAFSLSERLFVSRLIPNNIQDQFVGIFKKAFADLNSVSGYITFEKITAKLIPQESSLESILRLYWSIHSINFDKIARGYFWGNLISEKHIEKLNDIEVILREAPCCVKEVVEFDNRKAIYLQLTPDINQYSDEKLAELKKYMFPVLPEEDIKAIREIDPYNKSKEWSRLVFE